MFNEACCTRFINRRRFALRNGLLVSFLLLKEAVRQIVVCPLLAELDRLFQYLSKPMKLVRLIQNLIVFCNASM